MAFSIPTLRDLVERARQSFRAHLRGSDAWLWPNNVGPTAKVLGGMTHELFGYIDHVQLQKFAFSADEDGLADHAAEFSVPRLPAAPASGSVIITTTAGTTIPAAREISRSDNVRYLTTNAAAIATAGDMTVSVIAVVDGVSGNALAGTSLSLVSTIDTVSSIVVAAGGITGGDNVEGVESWRQRILFRKRNPAHGGAPSDYVVWAGEVSGVTRVFVERRYAGHGTVRVFVMMDGRYPDSIPPQFEIARVQQHIEQLAPSGAMVTVAAPTALPVDIVIPDLSPASSQTREAVLAELRDMFLRQARVAGADSDHPAMPYLATPYTFSQSWIGAAISNATGEDRHRPITPADDIAVPVGCIPTLGTVTFPEA